MSKTMIKENYLEVLKKVNDAAIKSNRKQDDVTLIAVSKTKPIEALKEAYDAGARDFGENKVQEILEKYDKLPKDCRWHMIGHLQTNKVKYIIDKVCMIHSVDSLKLAEVISKEAVKNNITMPILIEVNVADEDTKFGVTTDELDDLVEKISELPGIEVRGLMTVAPYVDDPEENRQYFVILRQLSVDMTNKNPHNNYVTELSMGMTGDYEVAISEGSTLVRVGTGIFGERNYNI